jgi:4-amino-4-deoxy-L-arabinose transferase-like glycosyltransferase
MFSKHGLRKLLSEHYALIGILIGVALVSFTISPFRNGDTRLEYAAATGVVNWGMPYAYSIPNVIDEPPLGFYLSGLVFKIFGLSVNNGVALITLFGLGCTVLLYKIGKEIYDKTTGLFAAALFGLAPWELILTRSFLIDAQCLFFSLLTLYFGIFAIRKDSLKLTAISGIFFALALITKLYAVFMLIPLLLLYLHRRPKNLKQILSKLGIFVFPAVYSSFLWYQLILGKGLLYMVTHGDFTYLNAPEAAPTLTFVWDFLVNYGLGIFFVAATLFSLIIGLLFRKHLPKQTLLFDLVCLITVVSILSVNVYLAVALNLKVPYTSAVKYDYQALPFFSLLVASLASKIVFLFRVAKSQNRLGKILFFSIVFAGLLLLVVPIFSNMYYAHELSLSDYLLFRVEPDKLIGYSLFNYFPTSPDDPSMYVQYLGFAFILSGLLWASKHKFLCQNNTQ